MERNKPFKAYIVDTEEVMTVYYAGSTGHDMVDIYKDGECVCHHHGKYWSVKEWSEALAEGIKETVKVLKEG